MTAGFNSEQDAMIAYWHKIADDRAAEIVRLNAALEAAERDAARYRWLRVHSTGPVEPWSTHSAPESLDAIVDASIDAARRGDSVSGRS
jgi:hypothetical protein